MNIINIITKSLSDVSGIENEYFVLGVITVLCVLIIKLIDKIVIKIYSRRHHKSKDIFKFRQRWNVIVNIIMVFCIFLIWEKHINSIVTIISFVSAAATIALREVILNFFAGIFIKTAKPFVIEDRIEVGDIKGDVVLITNLYFKVLEVGDRVNEEQSSGIIINVPNSFVFSSSLKNYTTVFKYIWSEMTVKIPIDADIDQSKKALYRIVNNNPIIKEIPRKMNKAIDAASSNYRIYYNNLNPIIYTTYEDNHIELCIRFLVHPKKERNVIDNLWISILKEHQKGTFRLWVKE